MSDFSWKTIQNKPLKAAVCSLEEPHVVTSEPQNISWFLSMSRAVEPMPYSALYFPESGCSNDQMCTSGKCSQCLSHIQISELISISSWHISFWHNFYAGYNKDRYVNKEWPFLKFFSGCSSYVTFGKMKTPIETKRDQGPLDSHTARGSLLWNTYLKSKYSGLMKEADLRLPRKRSRSNQS